jgi:hypothetical protein
MPIKSAFDSQCKFSRNRWETEYLSPAPFTAPLCCGSSILGGDKRITLVMEPRALLRLGAGLHEFPRSQPMRELSVPIMCFCED